MPGGFVAGLLRSFGQTAASEREIARRAQAEADDRELRVLQMAAGSDDPEIAARATTAMFQIASGSKKPKGGFLGALTGPVEPTLHPAVSSLLQLLNTPKAGSADAGPEFPSTPTAGAAPGVGPVPGPPPPAFQLSAPPPPQGAPRATPPPALPMPAPAGAPELPTPTGTPAPPPTTTAPPPGSAAMAPVPTQGSMTAAPAGPTPSPGPPPPLPFSPTTLTPYANARRLPGATPSVPRQMFFTSTQRMFETRKAQAQADVEGDVAGLITAGFTPDEAREIIKAERLRAHSGSGGAFQSLALEMPDGKGGWAPAFGTFNRYTGAFEDINGAPLPPGTRPRTSTGSTSMGTDREAIALLPEFGGKRYSELSPEQRTKVDAEVRRRVGETAFNRTLSTGRANAQVPLSTQQRFTGLTDLQKQWQTISAPQSVRRQQLQIMQGALSRWAKDPVGASEAIRVTFEKVLDPQSVVREAEYARQTGGLSVGDRLSGLYQKVFEGGGNVPYNVLAELVQTARQFAANLDADLDAEGRRLEDTARSAGIDAALIRGSSAVGRDTGGLGAPPPAVGGPTPTPTPHVDLNAGQPVPPQVLRMSPGQHEFANGQIWIVYADGKTPIRIQ